MTAHKLTLEIGRTSRTVIRALTYLMRDSRLNVSTRLVHGNEPLPRGRILRIEAGSLVEPVLTLSWGEDSPTPHDGDDIELALNAAIWTEHEEAWRLLATPLPQRVRLGHPDERRPWVLVAPGVPADLGTVERITTLHGAQIHHISPRGMPSEGVLWPPTGRAIASLLGHVNAVLAPPGPLAWDAARFGVTLFAPDQPAAPPREVVERRLARSVPAVLAQDREFWKALISALLSGTLEPAWGTASWIRLAREGRQTQHREPRWQRKLLKLKRDPAAFWADSWLARRVRGLTRGP